jgi:hypothetical protein
MIAQLLNQNVDVCARLHHLRHADFRKGRRLGKYDHIIVWTMFSVMSDVSHLTWFVLNFAQRFWPITSFV